MSRILAFVDNSPVSPSVIDAASALARMLSADVDVVHASAAPNEPIGDQDDQMPREIEGPASDALVAELGAADVLFGVIGSRSMLAKAHRVGHIAQDVLSKSTVPLVIIPPGAPAFTEAGPTILVPHDDTRATTRALAPMIELLSDAGARFVLLHVFDNRSVPPAVSSYDLDTIAEEFLSRHRRGNPVRCELRIGHTGTQIVEVASGRDIDAVLVSWRPGSDPGRAEVIAHLVRESGVPLIVVPVAV